MRTHIVLNRHHRSHNHHVHLHFYSSLWGRAPSRSGWWSALIAGVVFILLLRHSKSPIYPCHWHLHLTNCSLVVYFPWPLTTLLLTGHADADCGHFSDLMNHRSPNGQVIDLTSPLTGHTDCSHLLDLNHRSLTRQDIDSYWKRWLQPLISLETQVSDRIGHWHRLLLKTLTGLLPLIGLSTSPLTEHWVDFTPHTWFVTQQSSSLITHHCWCAEVG